MRMAACRVERKALSQLQQQHQCLCPRQQVRARLAPQRGRSQLPRRSDLLVAPVAATALQEASPSRSPPRNSNSSSSPTRSPSRPPHHTSTQEVVLSFFAALNSRDISGLLHTLAEDVVHQDLAHEQPATTKLEVARFYLDLFSSLASNMKFVVEDITGGDSSSVGVMWHIAVEGRELPLSKGLGFYKLNAQRRISFVRQSPEHFVKMANLALSATGMASPLVSVLGPAATPSFWSNMLDTAWALSASPAAGGVQQLLGSVDSTLSSLFSGETATRQPGGEAQGPASSQLPTARPASSQLPPASLASSQLPTGRSASSQLPPARPAASQLPPARPASSQLPPAKPASPQLPTSRPDANPQQQRHTTSSSSSSSSSGGSSGGSSSRAAATPQAQGQGGLHEPSTTSLPSGSRIAPSPLGSSGTGSFPLGPETSSGTSTSHPAPSPASLTSLPTPVSAQLLAAALSAAAVVGNAAGPETTETETTREGQTAVGSLPADAPTAPPAANLAAAGQLPPGDAAAPLDLSGIWSKVPELSQPEQYECALDLWRIHGLQRATARLIEGLHIQQAGARFDVHHLTLIPHFKVTECYNLQQQCKVMRRDLRSGQATATARPLANGRGVSLDVSFGPPMAGRLEERYESPEPGVLHVTSALYIDGQAVQAVQVYRLQRGVTKQQFIQASERRHGSAAEVLRRAGAPV